MTPEQNIQSAMTKPHAATKKDMIDELADKLGRIMKANRYQSGVLEIDTENGTGLRCEYLSDSQTFRFRIRDYAYPFPFIDYRMDVNVLALAICDFFVLSNRIIDMQSNTVILPIKVNKKAGKRPKNASPRASNPNIQNT